MQVRGSAVIQCSADEAFRFVANPANDPKWRSHIVSSRGSVQAVGDTVMQTYAYGGKSRSVVLEVSEYDPPERLAYVMNDQVRVRLAFHFRPEGNGTRVSVTLSSALTGPAAMFEGRIQTEGEKLIRTDLDRLKLACQAAE